MRQLNIEDFSYKGQKSQFQSDDTNMFLDDQNNHPIFGITNNTSLTDDKLSILSDFNYGRDRQDGTKKNENSDMMSDYLIQERMI